MKKRYFCDKGHSFLIDTPGTWTSMCISFNDPPQMYNFNYCMVCSAAELEKKFPLKCEEETDCHD